MNPAPEPELTPVAEDYLKAIWSATEWDGPPATVSTLAERFATSRATVSITLKRLARQGLLHHEPYGGIELTAGGARHATMMVRRHRLIETYLVRQLGYAWDDVHDEAERLEHAVSDTFVDRIDALLGHITVDPHGDPIPAPDGTVEYPDGTVHLLDAPPGTYHVVRVDDTDPARLQHLADHGVRPHTPLTVTAPDGGTRTVAPPRHAHALTEHLQRGIVVRPARADTAR